MCQDRRIPTIIDTATGLRSSVGLDMSRDNGIPINNVNYNIRLNSILALSSEVTIQVYIYIHDFKLHPPPHPPLKYLSWSFFSNTPWTLLLDMSLYDTTRHDTTFISSWMYIDLYNYTLRLCERSIWVGTTKHLKNTCETYAETHWWHYPHHCHKNIVHKIILFSWSDTEHVYLLSEDTRQWLWQKHI